MNTYIKIPQKNHLLGEIQCRNKMTLVLGHLFLSYLFLLTGLFIMLVVFQSENIYYIITFIAILIITIVFLFYILTKKTIYIYKNGLVGPFYFLREIVLSPCKTKFFIEYKKIKKIEFCKNLISNYIKVYTNNQTFQIGLKDGESNKLYTILNKLDFDLELIKCEKETYLN